MEACALSIELGTKMGSGGVFIGFVAQVGEGMGGLGDGCA